MEITLRIELHNRKYTHTRLTIVQLQYHSSFTATISMRALLISGLHARVPCKFACHLLRSALHLAAQ